MRVDNPALTAIKGNRRSASGVDRTAEANDLRSGGSRLSMGFTAGALDANGGPAQRSSPENAKRAMAGAG
jgi:hypothetical protein